MWPALAVAGKLRLAWRSLPAAQPLLPVGTALRCMQPVPAPWGQQQQLASSRLLPPRAQPWATRYSTAAAGRGSRRRLSLGWQAGWAGLCGGPGHLCPSYQQSCSGLKRPADDDRRAQACPFTHDVDTCSMRPPVPGQPSIAIASLLCMRTWLRGGIWHPAGPSDATPRFATLTKGLPHLPTGASLVLGGYDCKASKSLREGGGNTALFLRA